MKFKATLAATATMAILAGAAFAASETVVTTSPDGTKTTTTTTRYYYVDRDANNNGILDSNEFTTFVWNRWDRNGDGFLSDDEWQVSAPRWYGPSNETYKTYTAWDKDGNGRIDPDEFGAVVTTTKLYDTWDTNTDATIEGDEYASATFRLYDMNNDGVLSIDEWKNAQ